MRFGTSLDALRVNHEKRLLQDPITNRPGANRVKGASQIEKQEMQVDVSGTIYERFVAGVHPIDEAGRYMG